jgi:transcriptional regulator GlxA family with amidase domain
VAALCAQALATRPAARAQPGRAGRRLGSPAWLHELLALLHETAEPGLSLAQAGARLGRSPRQLQRDLAQASLGFATLRQAVRLERAQALLQDPTIELTEVAHAAGFFDSAHFNHCWWRACGLAPGQYRALLRLDTRPEVNH